jgi:uncharacterized protein
MVAGLLRLVLFAFVAYVAFLFLRVFAGLKKGRPRARPGDGREGRGVMVKDEVCGTYVPRDEALTDLRDGSRRYYCSEECRRKDLAR